MFELIIIVTAFVLCKFLSIGICGFLKIRYLQQHQVNSALIGQVLSNRQSGFDLALLLAEVPERTLRRSDAIGRKGIHVVFFLTSMIIVPLIALDHTTAIITGISVTTATAVAMLCLYTGDGNLSRYIYSPYARIMDGRKARLNIVVAQSLGVVQGIFLASLGYLALFDLTEATYTYALMYAVYLPVALGDTMGEIVGAFWGKHNIPVRGIGDTNKKTIAGTVAVFSSTLLALLLVWQVFPTPPGYLGLAVSICFVSTLVELYAPRSTDSFFIPVANVAVILIWQAILQG